ncbi:FAD-binding oxidoreductase [Nocardia sp. NPDC004860]|uniref:FAD-binding oxidoreductase n=1 Tax=Nocardia sp. NPDC004860 TaxID=3154557 RepID=UPI0033A651BB
MITNRALTHDLIEITLQSAEDADFLPGQFAMVSLDGPFGGSGHHERAYSMSNLANSDGIWQFQVKRVPDGAVSGRVTELSVGSTIHLDGPYGHAHLKDTTRDIVCVAGGSGLAPMVSVARGLAARGDAAERRLDFIYGVRTTRDRCVEEFVTEVAGSVMRTRLIEVLSAADEAWDGLRGYVHEALARYSPGELAERDIYVAGPPMMTDAVVRTLVLEWQIPVDQIHYDRFF